MIRCNVYDSISSSVYNNKHYLKRDMAGKVSGDKTKSKVARIMHVLQDLTRLHLSITNIPDLSIDMSTYTKII